MALLFIGCGRGSHRQRPGVDVTVGYASGDQGKSLDELSDEPSSPAEKAVAA
jgi:hypothetical protein